MHAVIWDWNGTLLDDVDACVQAINLLLEPRGLAPMTRARYHREFTFPVRRYYDTMGFDFSAETFDDVAVEYHQAYESVVGTQAPSRSFSPHWRSAGFGVSSRVAA